MMEKLDQQLKYALEGDFDNALRLVNELEQECPADPRAAFNRGFWRMREGHLLEGHKLMDIGRMMNVYGNRHIGSAMPVWEGQSGCHVLMEMEGGLGDQIHAVRYAKQIADKGNRVVLSGCQKLAEPFIDVEGVSAFVQHEAALGTYHTHWLPSMSAVIPLKLEWEDVSGAPYIPRTFPSEGKIGVKWSGNPMFEHEQHRLFPADLMFDVAKDYDCISLQRFDGETDNMVAAPDWMERPSLDTWRDTQNQISRCGLVITSCTAVAHMAGAMGIETWVVVPIMPYHLWALPGDKTPHYDSVTLFRQETPEDWEAPFAKIKERLKCSHTSKKAA